MVLKCRDFFWTRSISVFLWIKELFEDLFYLFYPQLCAVCSNRLFKGEHVICSSCIYDIPRTNFHLDKENRVAQVFWGRIPVESAASFYYFNKGSKYQKLIHLLKYRKRNDVGIELGKLYGAELRGSCFENADIIVPVPLHKIRLRKRGYNQSEMISMGLSEILNIPMVSNAIKRDEAKISQTSKTRYERWENVKDIFFVCTPEELNGKHILLVDDVITTGATLEAVAAKILSLDRVKVSILTLACA